MRSLNPYAGAHGSVLFDSHFLDKAYKFFTRRRIFVIRLRPVLQNADELAVAAYILATGGHRIDNVRAFLRDRALERARINDDGFSGDHDLNISRRI